MIVVNSLQVIKHCASVHACCNAWAVEAHEVALFELDVAAKVELHGGVIFIDVMDGVLGPDGFAIITWLLQRLNYWKLGRRGGSW